MRVSKKNRHHNGQKKKVQKDKQRSTKSESFYLLRGRRDRGRMVVGLTTTYAITTDIVSSKLDQGEVYNII
jgi:hypothetical protein